VRGNTTEPMPEDCDGKACLSRLVDFAEPTADDVCLDVAYGDAPVAAAMSSRVRQVASVRTGPTHAATDTADTAPQTALATDPRGMRDTAPQGGLAVARHQRTVGARPVRASTLSLPYRDGVFTLVTARCSLHRLSDPLAAVREMLRVCRPGGRLIIAGRIRTTSAAADALERLRDPAHAGTPSLARLTGLLADAGADVRRLDVFVVERPAEPWLAGCDDASADEIRRALVAEIDGGPPTGARPRMIGGELWFTQSCAHIAAVRA
jgi:SAM-dependent methyltransferase